MTCVKQNIFFTFNFCIFDFCTFDFCISNVYVLELSKLISTFFKKKYMMRINLMFIIKLFFVLLLLNSYSLWHRHKTINAKVSTYLIRKKNLNEEEKLLVFNFIATKIVVDKSTIIRRNDVYAHFLLLSSISNTENRLRDKSNERVFELF
jgi:hypothetical protein